MPFIDVFQSLNRLRAMRRGACTPALRHASHRAVGQLIESLEARQLLSDSHGTPAHVGVALHNGDSTHVAPAAPATVATDRLDYRPGQVAAIVGYGFGAEEKVRLQVLHIDGTPNTGPEHRPWIVRAATDGSFTASYTVGPDDLNTTLRLTAVGLFTHRRASEVFTDGSTTTTTVTSSTAPAPAPLVKPSHIVIVVEEDRYANAVGDTANMPYINQLASSGLTYTNSHGLNTTAEAGQMDYLALYSGSTQGVTDNGNHGVFSGPNLAQSLANNGLSFSGYAESLPSNGDTTSNYAADPSNPAYDDLYVRAYNPMAQFTNVGSGVTNASMNRTFASFPTTSAGFATLPTVSFVIPNTRHNTHGSNDTNPFATDPATYNTLRQSADTWLQQNMDGYLQWARQNNSLLIVTGDEGDRANNFAAGFPTIVNGSTNLFAPGADTASITQYNILRTVEDMYGLPQLGGSATTSELDTNLQGKLGVPQAAGAGSSVFGQSITFTANVTAGSGTPTGTVQFQIDGSNFGSPVTLASGSATSAPISSLSVASHTITSTYGGDANFNSSTAASFTQVVTKASTLTTIAPPIGAIVGQPVTFTATVAPVSPSGSTPTGSVQFQVDGANFGSPVTLSGGSSATSGPASLSTAGNHAVSAVYLGTSSFNGSTAPNVTQTINKASTAIALSSNQNPATVGQSVTFTANLSVVAPGSGTPVGSITFFDGSTSIGTGTPDATGKATFTTSSLSAASHSISATYAGTANYNGVTSATLNQIVNPSAPTVSTTTALAPSANPSVYGQAVSFTATVAPVAPATGTPTGTVQFQIDGSNFGAPVALVNGAAVSGMISGLSVTGHSIAAVYSGDTTYLSSTSPTLTQTVSQASTSASVSSSAPSAVWGQNVTFTATISPVTPAAGTPTGTVQFQIDGSNFGAPVTLVSGSAVSASINSLSITSHSVTASYVGDTNFTPSTSSTLTQIVSAASSSVTLASSVVPSLSGQSVTFTATVWPVAPGAGTPTGSITFKDGAATLASGTLNASRQFAFTTSTLSIGSHSITAVYSGDASFTGSTSAVFTQTVNSSSTGVVNDNFANATVITGPSITLTASNVGATKETGEPKHAGNSGGKSVWWSWTAPSSGTVTIDTLGSNFDTLLAVYTGTSVSALTAVASNDDSPAGGTVTSKVTFAVSAGTTYQIAVDGYGGVAGSITLHLNLPTGAAPAAPTGVLASDGTVAGAVQVTWAASSGATAYEVWRATTNNSASAAKISAADVTTTSYNDPSATPGAVYFYWVKAKNASGTSGFSASDSGFISTSNDNFANRTTLTGTSVTLTGTNSGATKEPGEPNHAGNAGSHSVWYTWTAPTSGTVTIDTLGSNFDTLLAVYTGTSVSALTTVASNDDSPAGGTVTSKVTFAVTAGTTYQIAVDGYGGATGSITLHLNLQ